MGRLVPSRMALKALLVLASVGLVYSQSHCSAHVDGETPGVNSGRDCTCGDKAFNECDEPETNDKFHTNSIDECWFQCDLFHSFDACDWFLYYGAGGMDENCHLFGPGKETMVQYVNSCNLQGGAIRNTDDACINTVGDYCDNGVICPGKCASCDDDPCEGYIETGCSIKATESQTSTAIPSLEECIKVMTGFGVSAQEQKDEANFFTYDKRGEICKAYPSGLRSCTSSVVQYSPEMTVDQIKRCQNIQ